MTKTIDALVEALEAALDEHDRIHEHAEWHDKARAALAQARAEQKKPVGVVSAWPDEVDWTGEKPPRGTPLFTTPPAAPVAKLEPWMVHARKLVQWRHCMSYNDSYFGESAGLLKHITSELERLLPEERLEAAHNAKLGGVG